MEDNKLLKLVPKNKFDEALIPKLMKTAESEIKPILPELFSWTADMNWPAAKSMVNVQIV